MREVLENLATAPLAMQEISCGCTQVVLFREAKVSGSQNH